MHCARNFIFCMQVYIEHVSRKVLLLILYQIIYDSLAVGEPLIEGYFYYVYVSIRDVLIVSVLVSVVSTFFVSIGIGHCHHASIDIGHYHHTSIGRLSATVITPSSVSVSASTMSIWYRYRPTKNELKLPILRYWYFGLFEHQIFP